MQSISLLEHVILNKIFYITLLYFGFLHSYPFCLEFVNFIVILTALRIHWNHRKGSQFPFMILTLR